MREERNWNQQIRKELEALAEPKFQAFTSRLMPGVENVLGVRLPRLRIIAGKIASGDYAAYLEQASDDSYEEIMLQGMVIGYCRAEFSVLEELIRRFVPKIDNWSVCDSFCSGLKIAGEKPEQMRQCLQPYLEDDRPYFIRFGVVMLLMYYTEEGDALRAFRTFDRINHEDYYVKMAVAWAISVYFVKLPLQTMEYLKENRLDDFTYNKALQKIRESHQVDKETKETVKRMKR